tara:strand:- start:9576 stop:10340 length:765 start_codon:yes stop_codon:yes gene_type:complete
MSESDLDDQQLLRYSRQIMLPQVDITGQQRLLDARVLILGAGGLGCPVALYLASSGVGHITIVDDDVVELSNLQRQILYTEADIGRLKAEVVRERLALLNPEVTVQAICQRPNLHDLSSLVADADLVLDGTDNFASRYQHNRICIAFKTPLLSAAVIRFEGQLIYFNPMLEGPCYACLYPSASDTNENCSENGVLAPVAGVMAMMMATEALKQLLKLGDNSIGRLHLFDALAMEWRTVKVKADPECKHCAQCQN